MNLPDNTVLKHFYTTLNGNVGATVLTGVPAGQAYPYVFVADQTGIENSAKDTWITDGTITLEVVHGYKGDATWVSVNTIANLITTLIRATYDGGVTLSGFRIIDMTLEFSEGFVEVTDKYKIYRKLLRYKYKVEQT